MKYGIFGDIHGNLAACDVVLAALKTAGCEKFICTGDVTGYGPQPHECVQRVREIGAACVLGNHDEYVSNLLDTQLARLDVDIRQTVEWMRSTLPMEDVRWLAGLPLFRDVDGLTVVHGMLGPRHWGYVTNIETLTAHLPHQKTAVCFNGHTHMPIYGCQLPGRPATIDFLRTTTVPSTAKVLINPGGVGQPRDRDPRAACCVYDSVTREVRPIRVEYDVEATQRLMRELNLPIRFIERLALGR